MATNHADHKSIVTFQRALAGAGGDPYRSHREAAPENLQLVGRSPYIVGRDILLIFSISFQP